MVWKEILEVRWKAGIALLVFITLAMGGPGLFWYMENNAEFKAQLQAMPPEMIGRLADYQALVHSNWFGQNVLQMGTIFAAILGCSAIAGETSKRTIEFLLTKPISRFRVLAIKMAVGVSTIGALVVVASALIYPASVILGYSVSLTSLLLASLLSWMGLAVMFALAIFFSAIFDDAIKAAAVTLIIALVLAIPGWFESISRFSIYNHMQNFESFQSGTLPWADVAFLVAAFVALTGATYALFRTKEF